VGSFTVKNKKQKIKNPQMWLWNAGGNSDSHGRSSKMAFPA
jgi:hypothetical protein